MEMSSEEFLRLIKKDPYLFLQKQRGKEFDLTGTVSLYEPYADFVRFNEKPDRITLIFDIGSISSKYDKTDIPIGSVATIKGKLNFIHWQEPNNLHPSLIGCELMELE